jgi:limonene-1,2-epoxide hydrolase
MSLNVSIAKFFNSVSKVNMKGPCEDFYDPRAVFDDPMVHLEGRDRLISYYTRLYDNVIDIHFDVTSEICVGDETYARWTMRLKHKRLKSGQEMRVDGVSYVKSRDGKAIYHRDYFDLGSMLYENIPGFGNLVKLIRGFAAGSH